MTSGQPADWLVPDWPEPAGVRAVFTSRAGGQSVAPFDSMNLGDHVGDVASAVAANRERLQAVTGTRSVFMKQIHGTRVLSLSTDLGDGVEADACVTTERDLACTVMVADCLPVLFCTADGQVVAAAHAGWRGLLGDGAGHAVLEATHAAVAARADGQQKIMAWLGPCIGPTAFEVGAEVKAAFVATQPGAEAFFVPHLQTDGKFFADLAGLARQRLAAIGGTGVYGNDSSAAWCTVLNGSRFFSHRRDAGVHVNGFGNGFGTTGRMAACIWRT